MARKNLAIALLGLLTLLITGCSGIKGGSSSGGGTTGGTGGGGTGGTGGGTGGGSTGPFTIGGTVVGLTGTGLVLQDNGGDNLTIKAGSASIPFTFATAVNGTYAVTILTQPSSPSQTCSVTNGSGTASGKVTTVQVNCAATYTVGGTVTGLEGSGLVLQDNGGDNLKISGTGTVNFTFAGPLLTGAAYAVTILTQPSNPGQNCTLSNATGTIIGSVTSVQISCPQPKFPIGGTVVGLVVGTGDTLELQDNAGDNLFVTGDVDFTFPTQFTFGTTYSVNLFLPPTSQPQGCNIFNATSVVKGIVSNVIVDCQHNDWAWMFPGTAAPQINTYGTAVLPSWTVGTPIGGPPFATSNTNSPGSRDFAMAWTDKNGSRWLFGGFGFEVTHPSTDGIPGYLNDMWVWPTSPSTGLDDGWWLPGGWVPANLPIVHNLLANSYSADTTSLQLQGLVANYGTLGVGVSCATPGPCTRPGSRWGGITWTDTTGNLWMFGGQGYDGSGSFSLLNDLWEFDITSGPCSYDGATGTGIFTNCQWIWKGGSSAGNQSTIGTFPGGRWGAASYTDSLGNVWMYGGQGYDSTGKAGLLNDLWKYSGGTWTLVSGTTTANQNGAYPASAGTGGAAFTPGGRQTAVLWVDSTGKIWLFGGFGLDSKGTSGGTGQIGSVLNDLWKFDPGTTQWTWVSGSNVANQNGVYGTQGISNATTNAAATNVPGSRWGAMGWVNPDGNLFFVGGFGYGSQNTVPTGFLNDVWEYQLSTGEWIWWKGSIDVDQPSTYIATPVNYFQLNYVNNSIGSRRGAAHWAPNPSGYVYLFGGEGYDSTAGGPYGTLNDVWRYLPFPTN